MYSDLIDNRHNAKLTSVVDGTLSLCEKAVDVLAEAAELVSVRVILGHPRRRYRLVVYRRSTRGEGCGHR